MGVVEWIFFSGRVLYTERDAASGTAIQERKDPPPGYERGTCGVRPASS